MKTLIVLEVESVVGLSEPSAHRGTEVLSRKLDAESRIVIFLVEPGLKVVTMMTAGKKHFDDVDVGNRGIGA